MEDRINQTNCIRGDHGWRTLKKEKNGSTLDWCINCGCLTRFKKQKGHQLRTRVRNADGSFYMKYPNRYRQYEDRGYEEEEAEQMSEFKKMMTAIYDQAHTHCVSWVMKQDDEDIIRLTGYMKNLTEDEDPNKSLIGYFSLLGLMVTLIELERE
jgi:hypothetical protein